MQDLIDFLARKEISIVVAILILAIVIYSILWFTSWIKKHEMKKKLKNNTMELKDLANKIKIEEKKEEKKKKNFDIHFHPVVEDKVQDLKKETDKIEIASVKEQKEKLPSIIDNMVLDNNSIDSVEILDTNEDIKYKEEVYTKEEAKEELNRIVENLKEQQEQIKIQTQEVEEKKEKEEQEDKNITLTDFENDQESNAIISLEELLEKGKTITQEEIMQYEDAGDEPITLEELEARYKEERKIEMKEEEPKQVERPKVELMDFYQAPTKAYSDNKSYHPTPIISPIFGIEEDNIAKEKALEIENTATFEKFDDEVRKTNQFLAKLKELQKALQKESD